MHALMDEAFVEKDRSIAGGTLRWFAVSLARGWRSQALAAGAVLLVSWPALLIGLLHAATIVAYGVTATVYTVLVSSVMRRYTLDMDALRSQMTGAGGRTGAESLDLRRLYGMFVAAMTVQFVVIYALSLGVVTAVVAVAPDLAFVASMATPAVVIETDRQLAKRYQRSILGLGVSIATRLASLVSIDGVRDRASLQNYTSVVATVSALVLVGSVSDLQDLQ